MYVEGKRLGPAMEQLERPSGPSYRVYTEVEQMVIREPTNHKTRIRLLTN